MQKRWTYTDWGTKLISITWEEQTVYYLYWGNDSHTKGNTVNYLHRGNGQHTKENTVSYLNGVTTNIKRKYRQLPQWGKDQHTKETGDLRLFGKRKKTCKLSVWLMKVCRKSTRFHKRFRQNPLGLVQDLRGSTRLGETFAKIHPAFDKRFARIHSAFDKRFARIHSDFDKRFARIHSAFARIHSAFDKRFARIHSAFDKRFARIHSAFARIHSAFDKRFARIH